MMWRSPPARKYLPVINSHRQSSPELDKDDQNRPPDQQNPFPVRLLTLPVTPARWHLPDSDNKPTGRLWSSPKKRALDGAKNLHVNRSLYSQDEPSDYLYSENRLLT